MNDDNIGYIFEKRKKIKEKKINKKKWLTIYTDLYIQKEKKTIYKN